MSVSTTSPVPLDVANRVVPCPRCSGTMVAAANATFHCIRCRMQVSAELFNPVAPVIHRPELALSEHATCVYHPQKRAVTVCQGTGNFICALCAVEIKGKTYSAQYLETSAGKKAVDDIAGQFLPRPDRVVRNIFWSLLIPYVNGLVLALFPVAAIYGYIQCGKIADLRRQNVLYRALVGKWRILIDTILLSLVLAGWLLLVLVLVVLILRRHFYASL